ncbi:MAG: hypothetical protein AAB586_00800 [Patescibacteria group bacterium]
MNLSSKPRVAVLRGGSSDAYEASLKTGGYILANLRNMLELYEPLDIFISKNGEWHREGLVHEPHRALQHVDVVWNALHGLSGADDQAQRVLEGLQMPFIGSSAAASALAMNQDMAKNLYRKFSLLTPAYEVITKDNLNEDRLIGIFRTYLSPIIVKPVRCFSGMFQAFTYNELKESVQKALALSQRVLVEEFIKGRDVACTVIENARGEEIYALLPTLSNQNEVDKQIEQMAKQAHQIIGLSHYSSSHFLVTPKKKIYILKTNSSPELHEDSLTYHALRATGWRPRDFVDHILRLAM